MSEQGRTDCRPVVLMLARDFQQGAEVCGPAQSISQMAALLGDRFRFRVLTRHAPDQEPDRWSTFMGVEQLGLQMHGARVDHLARAVRATPHDLLVMNSFWDPRFTIAPLAFRRVGRLSHAPVMIAPRGEFSPGALALKPAKKQAYLALAKATALLRGVTFQATAPEEADLIRQTIGPDTQVLMGPNLRLDRPVPDFVPREAGEPIRLAFISRIDIKKNLLFAIECVAEAGFPIDFTIYGPVTEAAYWETCQRAMEAAGAHARIRYGGILTQEEIPDVLSRTDLFFLPTLGENYGHAIVDALMAGTPVLISDRTPWHGLAETAAGWELPLDAKAQYVACIERVAGMSAPELMAMRHAALAYFRAYEDRVDPIGQMAACLERAMANG